MTPSSSTSSLSTLATESTEPPKPVEAPPQKQRYTIRTKPAAIPTIKKPIAAAPHGMTFMTEAVFEAANPPAHGGTRKVAAAAPKKPPQVIHESNAQLTDNELEDLLRRARQYKQTVMAIIGEAHRHF